MIIIDCFGDGSCKNIKDTPSDMGVGVVIFYKGKLITQIAKHVGKGTSNLSEWEALILALRTAVKYVQTHLKDEIVTINYYADSKVVVNMFNGLYSNKKFRAEYNRAKYWEDKLQKNHRIEVSWIPREENTHADKLSKIGNPYFIREKMTFEEYAIRQAYIFSKKATPPNLDTAEYSYLQGQMDLMESLISSKVLTKTKAKELIKNYTK